MIYVIIFFVSLLSLVAFLVLKSYHVKSNAHLFARGEDWYSLNLKQGYDRIRNSAHPFIKKGVHRFLGLYQQSVRRLRGFMRTLVQKLVKKYGDGEPISAPQSEFFEKIKEHKDTLEKE